VISCQKIVVSLFFFFLFSVPAFSSNSKKTILIIESYHPILEWTAQCEAGIKTVLNNNEYVVESFFMDTKRIPVSSYQKVADDAWNRFLTLKPDLVMLGDDNALKFLGPRFAMTKTPAVFFGINANPRIYFADTRLPSNMTGVLERTPVMPWLRTLQTIVPHAKRALVLMDDSETSKAILELNAPNGTTQQIGALKADWRLIEDWITWQKTVKETKNYDLIVMPTFHSVKGADGTTVPINEVIEWAAKNSAVPIFTNQDYTVNSDGVVGAYTLHGENHGKMAADIVVSILKDVTSPAEIAPLTDRLGKYYFCKKCLQKFGLTVPAEIEKEANYR